MRSALLALLLLACSVAPPASPSPTPQPLPAQDTRQQLVGTWDVVFTGGLSQHEASHDTLIRGLLVIEPVLLPSGHAERAILAGTFEANFVPMLGRHISCYAPRAGVDALVTGDSVALDFTPHWNDCGLWASGTFDGDSVTGRWQEPGYAGPTAGGLFKMSKR